MTISHEQWQGLPTVRIEDERYEAIILPTYGANCVSLIHKASGISMLRTPPNAEALCASPNVYGLPILFPPNRIRDGVFHFDGRTYTFPINEPKRHHHLHGVLSSTAFTETEQGAFEYRATQAQPYLSFPHVFTVTRRYCLTPEGLRHTIAVRNDSELPMPLGIGVHAAWNVPAPNWRLHMDVRKQWLVDERILPTGETAEDTPQLTGLREGTLRPEEQALSALLELNSHTVTLENGVWQMTCEWGSAFPFVMLWNGGGHSGFVCPEPQSWLVDAPNLSLPASQSGFQALSPGESQEYQLLYGIREACGG
ncbi:MAG: aldose 1-epimerase [Eubacteriales bacterium]|nr:aldose 1-epimerase [Eubacteriales bacterium]